MRVLRSQFLFVVLGGIGAVVAVFLGWSFFRATPQSVLLKDGSTLTIMRLDYGKSEYQYHDGGLDGRILHALIPRSWISEVRTNPAVSALKRTLVGRAVKNDLRVSAETNELVIWSEILRTNASVQVLPEDASGMLWENDDKNLPFGRIHASVTPFPRRERFVRLKVLNSGSKTIIGETTIPNPVFKPYPVWQERPGTAVVHDGDYEFTLDDFANTAGQYPPSHVMVKVLVTHGGKPDENWKAGPMEIEDATGNRWKATQWDNFYSSNAWTMRLNGVVPTNEVLRVRFKIWHLEEFNPGELWEVPNVSLGTSTEGKPKTTREGCTFQLERLLDDRAFVNVSSNFTPADSLWCVCVADILGENGNSIKTSQYAWGTIVSSQTVIVPVHYATPESRARFIFALTKAHTVEFFVRARNGR